jgi:tRNA-(ms[2]io[6]A)-hydroxylase
MINQLVNRLLCAALIEARSHERFRLLSEELVDQSSRKFCKKLIISQAHHYTLFLKFVKKFRKPTIDLDEKWKAILDFEENLMNTLGNKETMHG